MFIGYRLSIRMTSDKFSEESTFFIVAQSCILASDVAMEDMAKLIILVAIQAEYMRDVLFGKPIDKQRCLEFKEIACSRHDKDRRIVICNMINDTERLKFFL